MKVKLLEWIDDPKSQPRAQEILKAVFHYQKLVSGYKSRPSGSFIRHESQTTAHKPIFRCLSPLLEGWLQQKTNNSVNLTGIFITIFITILLNPTVCFKGDPPQDLPYQIALLDHGKYIRVSHLVRMGDAVCSFGEDEECSILRDKKKCPLDTDRNRIIRQDSEESGALRDINRGYMPKINHVRFCCAPTLSAQPLIRLIQRRRDKYSSTLSLTIHTLPSQSPHIYSSLVTIPQLPRIRHELFMNR
jgi:hypothetical protein